MDQITIDDFKKLDIRIGKIVSSEKVEWSEKLLKIKVDIGDCEIQILSGIYPSYDPDMLVGKLVPILVNLETRKIRDLESQGMMIAGVDEGKPVILNPDSQVPAGTKIS